MTLAVLYKLLAIMATVAMGWLAARLGWLGRFAAKGGTGTGGTGGTGGNDPARVLSNVAFTLFVPALLFRTMVRQDLSAMPWRTLAAYFVPAVLCALGFYAWQRRAGLLPAAAPATRSVAAVYGNAVQLGIPMAAALFGEGGLALHLALVSLHGVLLLTLLTVLVEADIARGAAQAWRRSAWDSAAQASRRNTADSAAQASRHSTLRITLRNTLIHPVVLPVILGLAWNLTGIGLHPVIDQTLLGLGSAGVPVCLVLIGVSLATHGAREGLAAALRLSAFKLLLMPAVVLLVAHFGFGLAGMPLAVLVMMAALPVGSNAIIFAQRYGTQEGIATLAILASTVCFMATAALWLAVLGAMGAMR